MGLVDFLTIKRGDKRTEQFLFVDQVAIDRAEQNITGGLLLPPAGEFVEVAKKSVCAGADGGGIAPG